MKTESESAQKSAPQSEFVPESETQSVPESAPTPETAPSSETKAASAPTSETKAASAPTSETKAASAPTSAPVSGTTTTATEDPFAGVPAPLAAAMQAKGFATLTPVQAAVVAAEAEGRNLRISSQTGSGKTVAIGMALAGEFLGSGESQDAKPKQRSGPSVLVITPTRELAVQVRDELSGLFSKVRGVSIEVVVGGTDMRRDKRNLARRPAIVVGTPGRMLDHIKTKALSTEDVGHVVLDEADQMLDMGFREELEAIVERLPEERRSHLVSATFPAQLRKLADRFQPNPLHLEGTRLGAANIDIEHVAHLVHGNERYPALVNLLLATHGERCLVFVRRRSDASDLAEKLGADGFSALPLSGDLPQAQRTRTLSAFRTGTVNIIIATDVAARGIDVADISTVIHGDVPENGEIYTHRSGRTGRAGRKGRSLLLVPPSGRAYVERILRFAKVEATFSPVPTAKRIHKTVAKQTRRRLYELLETDGTLEDKEVAYAMQLLEDKDPAKVVAALLRMSADELPCAPMNISPVDLHASNRSFAPRDARGAQGRGNGRDRDGGRGGAAARDYGHQGRGPRPGQGTGQGRGDQYNSGDRGPRRGPPGEFVRFFINWGERKGATPPRLMAHVCRRGGIEGRQVGAIQIDPHSASFEVSQNVAADFEQRAKKRDPRDPDLMIARHHGGGTQAQARPAGPRDAGGQGEGQRQRPGQGPGGPGRPSGGRNQPPPQARHRGQRRHG